MAAALHDAASAAFLHGFEIACLVAAAVALAGAVFALILLPAQPPQPREEVGKTAYAMSEGR